jgi:hypothetical protein
MSTWIDGIRGLAHYKQYSNPLFRQSLYFLRKFELMFLSFIINNPCSLVLSVAGISKPNYRDYL